MAGNIPITGLTMLGQTLLNAGTDYAAERRKTADEQRLRSEHLADVASQRQYEQQNFDKVRAIQLSDEQRRRIEAVADLKTRAALEARFKLLNEAQARGLIDAGSLGNQSLEDAAIHAISQQLAKESSFQQKQPENAASALAQLGQDKQRLIQQLSELEAKLASPEVVDPRVVAERALELATQQNGGNVPSRPMIDAAREQAYAEARQAAMVQDYQEKQAARIQQQLLTSQLNTIRQQEANLISTFKVAPSASESPLTQAPSAPSVVQPKAAGDPLAGFTTALDDLIAKRGIGAPNPGAGSSDLTVKDYSNALTMASPQDRPTILQGKTAAIAKGYEALDAPANQTSLQLAEVNNQLQRAQSGLNPFQGVTPAPWNASPAAAGEFITRLILKKSALQQQQDRELKARGQGKASLLANPLANTQTQFVPASAPSAGSVLSDPYSYSSPLPPAGLF